MQATIEVSNRWIKTFPGAHIGMLQMGNVNNTKRPTPLDDLKKEVVSSIHAKYAGWSRADLLTLEVLQAYKSYYPASYCRARRRLFVLTRDNKRKHWK
jgi:hypothetical protein